MGSQLKRKQPSRGHLQKMRSAGDVLENLPKELLADLDKPLDDGSSSQEPTAPVGGAPTPPANKTGKEVQPAPVPQPKPSPKAAPRKKPQSTRPTSEDGRAQSLEIGVSPPTQTKLPPGAFNIMGAIPMLGPASRGSADRGRSATVSTSLDREGGHDSMERGRGSVERQLEEELDSADSATLDASEKRGKDNTDQAPPSEQAMPNASLAPDISPKTPRKISVDELAVDSDPLSNSDSPQAPSKFEHTEPLAPAAKDEKGAGSADVDLDVVLTWSPDVTAAWVGSVGLASYQQMFIEKEIQGFMLFDLDGHKLKVRRLYMQHT